MTGSWTVTGAIAGQTLKTSFFTVGTLPAPAAAMRAYVTDSNVTLAAGHGNIVVGGGSNHCPLYYDGVNWRIG
jgi:hypothetical protein